MTGGGGPRAASLTTDGVRGFAGGFDGLVDVCVRMHCADVEAFEGIRVNVDASVLERALEVAELLHIYMPQRRAVVGDLLHSIREIQLQQWAHTLTHRLMTSGPHCFLKTGLQTLAPPPDACQQLGVVTKDGQRRPS